MSVVGLGRVKTPTPAARIEHLVKITRHEN